MSRLPSRSKSLQTFNQCFLPLDLLPTVTIFWDWGKDESSWQVGHYLTPNDEWWWAWNNLWNEWRGNWSTGRRLPPVPVRPPGGKRSTTHLSYGIALQWLTRPTYSHVTLARYLTRCYRPGRRNPELAQSRIAIRSSSTVSHESSNLLPQQEETNYGITH
jgi:hypothetical protein